MKRTGWWMAVGLVIGLAWSMEVLAEGRGGRISTASGHGHRLPRQIFTPVE